MVILLLLHDLRPTIVQSSTRCLFQNENFIAYTELQPLGDPYRTRGSQWVHIGWNTDCHVDLSIVGNMILKMVEMKSRTESMEKEWKMFASSILRHPRKGKAPMYPSTQGDKYALHPPTWGMHIGTRSRNNPWSSTESLYNQPQPQANRTSQNRLIKRTIVSPEFSLPATYVMIPIDGDLCDVLNDISCRQSPPHVKDWTNELEDLRLTLNNWARTKSLEINSQRIALGPDRYIWSKVN